MATFTPNLNLGKPDASDAFSSFRLLFNDNMDKIDQSGGGGGGGGGGFEFGAFINTNQIIQAQTAFRSSMTYTATEDCFVMFYIVLGVGTTYINIDGETVSTFYNTQTIGDTQGLYLRKGQTISASNADAGIDSYYIVYGLMQGTQGVFSPVIYSDNERLIGIWRDNKPLYQRSFPFTVNISGGQTATIAALSGVENIIHASGWLNKNNIIYFLNDYSARIKISPSGDLQLTSATGSSWNGSGYITLQYTKTADAPGSGDWNTDGVPTVHYSTAEQIIGTWIDGKPLYKTTFEYNGSIPANASTNIVNISSFNVESIQSLLGSIYEAGWGWEQVPTNNFRLYYNTTSGYIEAVTGAFSLSGSCYVTMTYTKTTD